MLIPRKGSAFDAEQIEELSKQLEEMKQREEARQKEDSAATVREVEEPTESPSVLPYIISHTLHNSRNPSPTATAAASHSHLPLPLSSHSHSYSRFRPL